MKRFLGILAGLLLMAGCANDDFKDNGGNMEGVKLFTSLTATFDGLADTRAHITEPEGSGKKYVGWDAGDEILVFSDSQNDFKTYSLTSVSDNGVGIFSGNRVSGNKFYALYPKGNWIIDEENPSILHLYGSMDFSTLTSSDQNGFSIKAPMVAISDGDSFSFMQTTGLIHISIGNVNVLKSVSLESNNGEAISSYHGQIDLSEETPTYSLVTSGDTPHSSKISGEIVKSADSETTDIYFMLPPMTLEKGFTLYIEGTDDEGENFTLQKTSAEDLIIERGTVNHFRLINVQAELEEMEANEKGVITPSAESAIFFEKGVFLPALKSTQTIKFSSSAPWTLSLKSTTEEDIEDFYDINPSSGEAGEAEVAITLYANIDSKERNALFSISAGDQDLDIEFKQEAMTDSDIPEYVGVSEGLPDKVDYAVVCKNGLIFYYKCWDDSYFPQQMSIYNNNIEDFDIVVDFDISGFPTDIICDEFTAVFNNYRENYVDATIFYKNGEFEILKGIECEDSWDDIYVTYGTAVQTRSEYAQAAEFLRRSTVKFSSAVLTSLACNVGLLTSEIGIGLALAAVSCVSQFALWKDFFDYDIEAYKASKKTDPLIQAGGDAALLASLVKCGINRGFDCFEAVVDEGLWILDGGLERFRIRNDRTDFQSITQKMGRDRIVEIILAWKDKHVDLSLGCVDPQHGEYGYSNTYGRGSVYGSFSDFVHVTAEQSTQYKSMERIYYEDIYPGNGNFRILVRNEGVYLYGQESVFEEDYLLGFILNGKGKIVKGKASRASIKFHNAVLLGNNQFTFE